VIFDVVGVVVPVRFVKSPVVGLSIVAEVVGLVGVVQVSVEGKFLFGMLVVPSVSGLFFPTNGGVVAVEVDVVAVAVSSSGIRVFFCSERSSSKVLTYFSLSFLVSVELSIPAFCLTRGIFLCFAWPAVSLMICGCFVWGSVLRGFSFSSLPPSFSAPVLLPSFSFNNSSRVLT